VSANKLKPFFADDLVGRERRVTIYQDCFQCPYCDKEWRRGGKKEGFVKSAANNHVFHCYELRLIAKGFLAGNYIRGRRTALPFEEALKSPRGKIVIRSAKGALNRAIKTGRYWPGEAA
jgi:hypothetical protein